MSQGSPTDVTKLFTIFFEVVSEDEQDRNPVEMGEVANQLVEVLRIDGYTVMPVNTEERGGEKFEIIPPLQNLYQFSIMHKDDIISVFKSIIMPIVNRLNERRQQRLAKLREKQDVPQPELGGVKLEVQFNPDSWYIKAESNDSLGTMQIEPLINQVVIHLKSLTEQSQSRTDASALPPLTVTITEEVSAKGEPRRIY